MRPSDWSFGVSVQQEIFPRASVEVGYYRRAFTQYTTGGTVTDNLAVSPNDVAAYTVTAPSDPRLPGSGGYTVGPLYDLNPNVFGQVQQSVQVDEGRRRRHARVQRRGRELQRPAERTASRSRAAPAPARWTTTGARSARRFRRAASAEPVLPRRVAVPDVVPRARDLHDPAHRRDPEHGVSRTRPNIGTDQIVLAAGQLHAHGGGPGGGRGADRPSADEDRCVHGQPDRAGPVYGDRIRQLDLSVKKIIRFGGQRLTAGLDIYNLMNNNVTLAFNQAFVAEPRRAG